MADQSEPAIDVYDKTRAVRPAIATSDGLPWPIECFTNGKNFFLSDQTVAALASEVPDRLVASAGGWAELVDGQPRPLGERHINGGRYFKFGKSWKLRDST